MYTYIPQEDDLQCTREFVEKSTNNKIITGFIIRLLNIFFKYNIFKKLTGTEMGNRASPPYSKSG